ncbi:DUF3768 domain-containing protein [Oricola indica]|uniref:DUF3768 domain-containing protein n=1 Tax=Oricola indica TaxID=2872591 RepID=UPI003CCBABF6
MSDDNRNGSISVIAGGKDIPKPANDQSMPTCSTCGSPNVLRDAWAVWDTSRGRWALGEVFDHAHCADCEGDTHIEWRSELPDRATRIRMLNDRFRRSGVGNGRVMITAGVVGEGNDFVTLARKSVAEFDDFSADNDPHGEHDFGTFELDGQKLFWKIDYFAPDLLHGSENPAIGAKTVRVLTIMLASDY